MKNFGGDIRIIGPRPSGKITYLTTLAYFPQAGKPDNFVKSVQPSGDTERLIAYAEDILKRGLKLAPMFYRESPYSLPFYALRISLTLPEKSWLKVRYQDVALEVDCRPYPGEFFMDLLNDNERIISYLYDLATVNQVILMIDVFSSEFDKEYADSLHVLEQELKQKYQESDRKNYRLAVVFSKFDRAYIYRNDLAKFINLKYFNVKSVLEQWRESWSCSIEYFACSAYGMIGDPPQPNEYQDGGCWGGYLKNPNEWKPFGLVSPIYWLLTGKRDSRLDFM